MPVYLKGASSLDQFRCTVCGGVFPRIAIHEHHKVKQADGGQDDRANIALLDANCHQALHQIETALRNPKRRNLVPEMLQSLFPQNQKARETILILASTAALGRDATKPEPSGDFSDFDTDDLVHLTSPKVPPWMRDQVSIVCGEMRGPSGRRLGVGDYLRGLVEQDLRKRGLGRPPRKV